VSPLVTGWSIAIKNPGALNLREVCWIRLASRAMDSSWEADAKRLSLSMSNLPRWMDSQGLNEKINIFISLNKRALWSWLNAYDPLPAPSRSRRVATNLNLNRRGAPGSGCQAPSC
jgi:hypothetical protein